MISLEKLKIVTPLQKFPKNVRDLGKLFVAKGLKKLPKVQKIARSGHTDPGLVAMGGDSCPKVMGSNPSIVCWMDIFKKVNLT